MREGPALQPLPPGIAGLADHEAHARQTLPATTWAWFAGGAADDITLAANRRAWGAMPLWPRVLRPLAGGHTRRTLRTRAWQRELPAPLFIAPMALQRALHPDGELASAHAAAALGAGMILSMESSTPLEAVARAMQAGDAPLWFQLCVQHDRAFALELVQRAEAAGVDALVLTVDAPVSGVRAPFQPPPGVERVHLRHMAPMPPLPAHNALFDGLLAHAPTWADVDWLRAHTRLPLLLKGILHPLDALEAARLGLDGIIVSNHGGRTLDSSVPTAQALAQVARALGALEHRPLLLADGGLRRGSDVLKALALGADAVLLGRPVLWGLANAGASGVAHVLRLMRDELEIAMALSGCATLEQVSAALLGPSDPFLPEPPMPAL